MPPPAKRGSISVSNKWLYVKKNICHSSDIIHYNIFQYTKRAFTLAEVLITLGIIGVVAPITMPVLITKYQKDVTVNKLKKSYTTISQMFQMAQNENGDPSGWNFDFTGSDDTNASLSDFINTYMIPYLKVADNCGTQCKRIPEMYSFLNNNPFNTTQHYIIFLQDGTTLILSIDSNKHAVIIHVDINGNKNPNKVGRDVFTYYLNTSKTITKQNFWGLDGNFSNVSRDFLLNDGNRGCKKNSLGYYCGALIQYDGWKIKDDYPW